MQRHDLRLSVRDFGYGPDEKLHYGGDHPLDEVDYQHWQYETEDTPPWLRHSHSPNDMEDVDNDSDSEIHGRAIALFDFEPENDNEVRLREGQLIWISYRHGQGWLVAEDDETHETGLVPEEYVQLLADHDHDHDLPTQVLPDLLPIRDNDGDVNIDNNNESNPQQDHDSDWIDEDSDELPAVEGLKLK
ncbi:CYFA0S22e00518g1_1 [Cyberlindnera fabianii]|uniref:CYFA0S22e00518g1_1 n=1 Tax=Cyberlindnera fabianii TaxID=36022 RepID=A0A061B9X4_CYBFA|nr:CYFA0S22e00518g1_1 [Cyberlindnera fabianii]